MRRLNVLVCLILLNLPVLIVMNMTDNVNRFCANRQSVWVFSYTGVEVIAKFIGNNVWL